MYLKGGSTTETQIRLLLTPKFLGHVISVNANIQAAKKKGRKGHIHTDLGMFAQLCFASVIWNMFPITILSCLNCEI